MGDTLYYICLNDNIREFLKELVEDMALVVGIHERGNYTIVQVLIR